MGASASSSSSSGASSSVGPDTALLPPTAPVPAISTTCKGHSSPAYRMPANLDCAWWCVCACAWGGGFYWLEDCHALRKSKPSHTYLLGTVIPTYLLGRAGTVTPSNTPTPPLLSRQMLSWTLCLGRGGDRGSGHPEQHGRQPCPPCLQGATQCSSS